jgi:hypothetical protein
MQICTDDLRLVPTRSIPHMANSSRGEYVRLGNEQTLEHVLTTIGNLRRWLSVSLPLRISAYTFAPRYGSCRYCDIGLLAASAAVG